MISMNCPGGKIDSNILVLVHAPGPCTRPCSDSSYWREREVDEADKSVDPDSPRQRTTI